MTRFALRLTAATAALFATVGAEDLTIDALNGSAGLSGPSLRGASFSPNGDMVTVLRGQEDDARKLDLWAYDTQTGEARILVRSDDLQPEEVFLSEEERNRRERQRIYDTGIISYQWDSQGERILFPLGGDVYFYDLTTGAPTQVTESEGFETDARISPNGSFVSYVRGDELYVYNIERGRERKVTRGATETIRNAVAEFVVQEELSRSTGYWWSPDDTRIAYTQIDESPVDVVERLDFGPDGSRTISQRYPFAGTDNVTIRLGITTPRGGRTTWVDLGDNPDIYVVDVHWSRDGETLYVERLSRDQKRLDMLAVNPSNGQSEILFSENEDTWINMQGGFRALSDGGFLWLSERDGWNHIYRYGADGGEPAQLTSGEWPVSGLNCINEDRNTIYFSGWQETALDRHIYSVSLDGGATTALTTTPGSHGAAFGGGCESFIHRFSSDNQPAQASVMGTDGERRFWLLENELGGDHPYAPYLDSHLEWQYGQLPAEDGQMMDYALLVPPYLGEGDTAPAIQLVYGGPHVQRVRNSWGDLYAQFLADQGYVVFRIDNRGAANRGTEFENVIHLQMGQPEVRDQAVGTEYLASLPFVDADRIGVQGWSYGGYMALMMLGQRPDLYAAGISGAPVTDWRTYDTAYTERYMGDPREVPEAYDAASVLTYAGGIEDDALLLIHGMADDNVIFQNTIDIMSMLQQQGTEFDLMTYPGEKHGFRNRENRMHRDIIGVEFFRERLMPGQ